MNNIENLFKGFDKNKVVEAMKKAEILAKNDDLKKVFSGADKNKIMELFKNLNPNNQNEVMNALLRSDTKGISELLRKIKG